jgi:hypothetical protein
MDASETDASGDGRAPGGDVGVGADVGVGGESGEAGDLGDARELLPGSIQACSSAAECARRACEAGAPGTSACPDALLRFCGACE